MKTNIILLSITCLIISACGDGDMKDRLGLNRKGPDEFQVVSRPPLSVPPEFNLRAPRSATTEAIASGQNSADQARDKVLSANSTNPFGASAIQPVTNGNLPTTGDSRFLSNAGADKASGNIRQKINDDAENGVGPKDNKYLFGLGNTNDPLVDSQKEAERLKQDKAANKAPTEGTTPVINEKGGGLLGNIF